MRYSQVDASFPRISEPRDSESFRMDPQRPSSEAAVAVVASPDVDTGSENSKKKPWTWESWSKTLPLLATFILFPKLPPELRQIVWRLTLQPRIIEVKFIESRGFYTQVPTPTALQVCRESRSAVLASYPTCFGNVIYTPLILFNFSLDTLYFDQTLQHQVQHFAASLKREEVDRLRYLAVDSWINHDFEGGYDLEINPITIIRKLVPHMLSLKEFLIVYDLALWGPCGGYPCGCGPMQLYENWPPEVWAQHSCYPGNILFEDEIESDYECDEHQLPGSADELSGLKVSRCGSIWGWRPTTD